MPDFPPLDYDLSSWGRERLSERIRSALASHDRMPLPDGPVPAAVLVPVYDKGGAPHLLFTKRTEHLHHHRGEISFPGGVCHAEDGSPLSTALRETEEEVGIPATSVKVLGGLDDILSVHNYRVTPFVGWCSFDYPLKFNRAEIDKVLEVPLAHLLRPEIFRVEDWTWKGRQHPVFFYSFTGHEIWGLTAAILKQFLDLVFPRG